MCTRKFWMVIRLSGNGSESTRVRHYSEQEALDETARLSREERATFILLEATNACVFPGPDLEWIELFEAAQEEVVA